MPLSIFDEQEASQEQNVQDSNRKVDNEMDDKANDKMDDKVNNEKDEANDKKEGKQDFKKNDDNDKSNTQEDNNEDEQDEMEQDENEGQENEDDNEPSIFDTFNKKLGIELPEDVSFEESTEGMVDYISHITQQEIKSYEQQLQEKYPNGWKALLYEAQGGNPKDLFSTEGNNAYNIETLDKDDEKAQREILQSYYKDKGLNENVVNALLDNLETEGTIYDEAKSALEKVKEDRMKQEEEIMKQQEEKVKQQQESDNQFLTSLSSIIDKGEINNFRIPNKQKDEFKQFVTQHIQYDGKGGYQLGLPMDDEQKAYALQSAFMAFRKGDINDLVKRKADNEFVKRIKGGTKPQNTKKASNKDNMSLRDMFKQS